MQTVNDFAPPEAAAPAPAVAVGGTAKAVKAPPVAAKADKAPATKPPPAPAATAKAAVKTPPPPEDPAPAAAPAPPLPDATAGTGTEPLPTSAPAPAATETASGFPNINEPPDQPAGSLLPPEERKRIIEELDALRKKQNAAKPANAGIKSDDAALKDQAATQGEDAIKQIEKCSAAGAENDPDCQLLPTE